LLGGLLAVTVRFAVGGVTSLRWDFAVRCRLPRSALFE
jgi:hypothetical protein